MKLCRAMFVVALFAAPAAAQEEGSGLFSGLVGSIGDEAMEMPTLGGRLFWGDVLHFRGWRIQQNVLDKHHRLLDAADRRHAHGSYEDCIAALERMKQDRGVAPLSGKAVILVHGMGRSSKSWPAMRRRFEEAGYLVVGFDYPSTRCAITESADYLAKTIASLEGVEEINLVTHSMGGLVSRAYLAKHSDERIRRMVMLGVPNRGAEMADRVVSIPLYKWICGPGGCELVTDPDGLIASLPTPEFEFAIVSGGRGTLEGYNPLIPGDDDGTVTVASTRLPGATDFLLVEGAMHSFLMFNDQVIDATVRFVDTGRLREEGEPRPIPREIDAETEVEAGRSNDLSLMP